MVFCIEEKQKHMPKPKHNYYLTKRKLTKMNYLKTVSFKITIFTKTIVK